MISIRLVHVLVLVGLGFAQIQAPALEGLVDSISPSDRIYTGDQTSNTITVIKPSTNEVLGTIALGGNRLGDMLNPQYVDSVNAHGLGFSRDGKYIVSLSVTSNTATVIRTIDNTVVSETFTDRGPHEAFFEPNNRTIWIGTRGVDSINLVDVDGGIVDRIPSYGGPSKVLFSPDGKTAYVNHIRSASIDVINVGTRQSIHNITGLADVFSSDMMLDASGKRLWVAHKKVGKISVISTVSRKVIDVIESGGETNHPNFAIVNGITYAYVTVASTNSTLVYAHPHPEKAPKLHGSVLSSGIEPHGLWPSPDNSRMYIINEHSDTVDVVNTKTLKVVKTLPIGQEGQALVYVANAVPHGDGLSGLGSQGFSSPPINRLVKVSDAKKKSSALITIRKVQGLDMFQVIGRELHLNAIYRASAVLSRHGVEVPLVEFNASVPAADGCGSAPQVLGFFKFQGVYDPDSIRIYEV